MSDVPLTASEDPRWMPSAANSRVGNRGHTGLLATYTTNGAAQSNVVISTKDCAYGNDASIRVQYAILAPGAPSWLYEDGYPALLDRSDLGFSILMRRAGAHGNYYTLTLINPGRTSSLGIRRPGLKDVVISLAYASGAVTTTPALLIAAINNDPELSRYMMAFASSAAAGVLPAMAARSFTGGFDSPGLVLVSVSSTNVGVGTGTGTTTLALLNGSRYVSATMLSGNTGAGLVAALGPVALTGSNAAASAVAPIQTLGTPNRGEMSDQYLARRDAWGHRRRAGDPLGKEHNRTLQLRDSRFGAIRTYQRVPKQDRAVTVSRVQNHQSDWLAHATLG